jgi:hypothetical protein
MPSRRGLSLVITLAGVLSLGRGSLLQKTNDFSFFSGFGGPAAA